VWRRAALSALGGVVAVVVVPSISRENTAGAISKSLGIVSMAEVCAPRWPKTVMVVNRPPHVDVDLTVRRDCDSIGTLAHNSFWRQDVASFQKAKWKCFTIAVCISGGFDEPLHFTCWKSARIANTHMPDVFLDFVGAPINVRGNPTGLDANVSALDDFSIFGLLLGGVSSRSPQSKGGSPQSDCRERKDYRKRGDDGFVVIVSFDNINGAARNNHHSSKEGGAIFLICLVAGFLLIFFLY
jgi:hypothetical protein